MNLDYSLLDANLARAKEGLRVLDEIGRFIYRDQALFLELKKTRHALVAIEQIIGQANLWRARQGNDVGHPDQVPPTESAGSLWSIIAANGNRATEALRVLEEFGKVYFPQAIPMVMRARYDVYATQRTLALRTPHFWLRNYFEQGIVYPLSDSVLELQWLIQHGARVVQLRDKESSSTALFEKAKSLLGFIKDFEQAQREKIVLIINDDVSVAARLPVAGVHLGQGDENIVHARRQLGSNKIIGRSNGTVAQMQASVAEGADYVSLGPIFATPLKPDRVPVGLEMVAEASRVITAPWVVIGGITPESRVAVQGAGARNVAVIRSAREFFK